MEVDLNAVHLFTYLFSKHYRVFVASYSCSVAGDAKINKDRLCLLRLSQLNRAVNK